MLRAVDHGRHHERQLGCVVDRDDPGFPDRLVAFEEERQHGAAAGVERQEREHRYEAPYAAHFRPRSGMMMTGATTASSTAAGSMTRPTCRTALSIFSCSAAGS